MTSGFELPVTAYTAVYPDGEYRVYGIEPGPLGVGKTRDEADAACLAIEGGRGLAAPTSEEALAALTDVIRHSVETEPMRRDAVAANEACEQDAAFAVHSDYEPRCKDFCNVDTWYPNKFDTFFIRNVTTVEECGDICMDTPECLCAFYTLFELNSQDSLTCWLKAVPCDSEALRRYDDSTDELSHQNIQPCKSADGVNRCCVHKLQRRYWVAGIRTGFDEPDCRGPLTNNGQYPFFDATDGETGDQVDLISRFNNCGQDKVRNWAWLVDRDPGQNGVADGGSYIRWRDLDVPLYDRWEPKTLVPNGLQQPTGWIGFYETTGNEPGYYQNCTAAKVYVPGDGSGVELGSEPDAYGQIFWHDLSCTEELLDRWVCDFETSSSSSGASAGAIAGAVIGAVVVVAAVVLLAVFGLRRRRRRMSSTFSSESKGTALTDVRTSEPGDAGPGKGSPSGAQPQLRLMRFLSRGQNQSGNSRSAVVPPPAEAVVTGAAAYGTAGDETTWVRQQMGWRTDVTQLQTVLNADTEAMRDGGSTYNAPSLSVVLAPLSEGVTSAAVASKTENGAPREPELLATSDVRSKPAMLGYKDGAHNREQKVDYRAAKAQINTMLDSFENSDNFFRGYKLRQDLGRREGGQGVVAFVEDGRHDVFAVKLFAAREHFDAETAMYRNDALSSVLPVLREAEHNEGLSLISPLGLAYPPFVILDKGQPFNEWCERSKPDFATCLQVLMHIAGKLASMHESGWVHRDVKNSNVIWTDRINSWELIDFATAAPIGKPAHIIFTMMWAAPETIAAIAAKETAMVVSGAVDVWALGMMAWDMLVGESAWTELIDEHGTAPGLSQRMMQQLLGKSQFPWEKGTLDSATRRRLGIMRPAVLAMLRRDPTQRPTMRQLVDHWTSLFQGADTLDHRHSAELLSHAGSVSSSDALLAGMPAQSSRTLTSFDTPASVAASAGMSTLPAGSVAQTQTQTQTAMTVTTQDGVGTTSSSTPTRTTASLTTGPAVTATSKEAEKLEVFSESSQMRDSTAPAPSSS